MATYTQTLQAWILESSEFSAADLYQSAPSQLGYLSWDRTGGSPVR